MKIKNSFDKGGAGGIKRVVLATVFSTLWAMAGVALADPDPDMGSAPDIMAGDPARKIWNDNPDLDQGAPGWETRLGHWHFLTMANDDWAGDENNYVDWPIGSSAVTLKAYDTRLDAQGVVAELRQAKSGGPTLDRDVVVVARIKAVAGGRARFPSNMGVAFGILCENTVTGETFYFEPYIRGSGVNRIWQQTSGAFYRWQGVPHQTLYLPAFPEFCRIQPRDGMTTYTVNLSLMFQDALKARYLPLQLPLHRHTRLHDPDPAHWQVKTMTIYPENQYLLPLTNGDPQQVTIDYFALTYLP